MKGTTKMPKLPSMSTGRIRKSDLVAIVTVVVLIFLFVAVFSTIRVLQHRTFQTHAWDLANMDQAVWNTLHGRFFEFSTVKGATTRLTYHFEPILVPIALLYLLHDSAETLLILQTLAIALGAFPLFLLAKNRIGSNFAGVAFAVAYLLYPSLEAANFFDFHPIVLAVPFLMWALYLLLTNKPRQFFIVSLLAMTCREDIPLLVIMMGLYAFFILKERKWGGLTIIAGIVGAVIGFILVIPAFRVSAMGNPFLIRYGHIGNSPLDMLQTVLTRPGYIFKILTTDYKLSNYYALLFPFAFTSLFSPLILCMALPSFAINFLSQWSLMHNMEWLHFAATLVPFIVVSGVEGVAFLARQARKLLKIDDNFAAIVLALIILGCSFYHHYYRGFSPASLHFQLPRIGHHHRVGERLVSMIPPQAAVSAQSDLAPHLSHRQKLYVFPRIEDAEYIFLDVTSIVFPMKTMQEFHDRVTTILEAGPFGILAAEDGYLLLQRGLHNTELPDEFYTFARAIEPTPEFSTDIRFGSGLQLIGFDITYGRNAVATFSLYIKVLERQEDELRFCWYLVNENGETLAELTPVTTTWWYPPEMWQVGEIVRLDTTSIGLARASRVTVALRVISDSGSESWRALNPQPLTTDFAVKLFHDGTSVGIRTYQYKYKVVVDITPARRFTLPEDHRLVSADYNFNNKVKLVGYALSADTARQGDSLHLTLYWQALERMTKQYTIFTHLLSQENLIWGQKDNQPINNTYPTNWWMPGEIVVDEYDIPVTNDAPPGRYALEVGLYLWTTGERLNLVQNGIDTGENRIILTEIEVLPTD